MLLCVYRKAGETLEVTEMIGQRQGLSAIDFLQNRGGGSKDFFPK